MRDPTTPFQIKYYRDARGRAPFLEWLEALGDRVARAKIKTRIDRLERGHFGDYRFLGGGVHELKIHFGPGYRIYFGIFERTIVVILHGGSKQTQERDIQTAKERWMTIKEGNI
jgi:putative addiction module killer protein